MKRTSENKLDFFMRWPKGIPYVGEHSLRRSVSIRSQTKRTLHQSC